MSKTYNVLFLCTGNSARSILAEAILNKEGAGRFRAFSAGSHPKGEVHPAALTLLHDLGYATDAFRSKSWGEFAVPSAPPLDFVFTVCDSAAGEICPIWPGQPMTAHWGIEDPAGAEGDRQPQAFREAFFALLRRIQLFLSLPLDSIDQLSLQTKLREIGRSSDQSAA
jgi:protein-tyrosine-phosphatase